ncbi:MAG: hypothetical protein KDB26_12315, partial [Microthrixaceae bacterium]|nr:hypothetical protein [Microthrixaceae bacterium]
MPRRTIGILQRIWLLPLFLAVVLDVDTVLGTSRETRFGWLIMWSWLPAIIVTCWMVISTLRGPQGSFETASRGVPFRPAVITLSAIGVSVFIPIALTGQAIPSAGSLFSGLVLTGVLAARSVTRTDLILVGVAAVLGVAPMALGFYSSDGLLASMSITVMVIAVTIGLLVREQRRRIASTRRIAIQGERMAIARELHDSVAHELTGILVLARANMRDKPTSATSEHHAVDRTQEVFELIAESSQRALDEIRTMVSTIDTPEPPRSTADADQSGKPTNPRALSGPTHNHSASGRGPEQLRELVEAFASSTAAVVNWEFDEMDLTPSQWLVLHRVCAEGLTNIRRHAGDATLIEVRLTVEDGVDTTDGFHTSVSLVVSDNGVSGDGIGGGSGTGIAGARRRIEAMGGRLTAGRDDDGFWRLRADLPGPDAARSTPEPSTRSDV